MRLVIIDPKMVEMQGYQSLPHLAFPIVTDPKKVLLALAMAHRRNGSAAIRMFARVGVRNIVGFNARPKKKTQKELDADAAESGVYWIGHAGPLRQRTLHRSKCRAMTKSKFPREFRTCVVIIDELAD
jgi:S-DNA-T family DNA segregation ATPase FtsK/SpoIIIE